MNNNVDVMIRPQGIILNDFLYDRSRVSFIRGPLGSGKTIASCTKLFNIMCEQEPNSKGVRPTRFVAIRNTYNELDSTTIKDWMETFGSTLGKKKGGGGTPVTWYGKFKLPDGTLVKSEILFLALDKPDSDKKLRGTQITGFWFNEAKELPKKILDMADGRHGRYPNEIVGVKATWHGIIGDTNSPDEDHWFNKVEIEEKEKNPDPKENWEFFVQPGGIMRDGDKRDSKGRQVWKPNPEAENVANLPGGHGYYMNQLRGDKDESWVAVNLGNEVGVVNEGKPIFPLFDQQRNEQNICFDPSLQVHLGWDFGITPACVVVQHTKENQVRIIAELVGEGMGIAEFATNIVKPNITKNFGGCENVGLSLADPAGKNRNESDGNTAIGILNDQFSGVALADRLNMGFKTQAAPSQSPVARIEAVNSFLNRSVQIAPGKRDEALLITPECKMLVGGFKGGYRYKRVFSNGESRYMDKPDKNKYSHIHDALQYVCLGLNRGINVKKEAPKMVYKGRNNGFRR